MMNNQRGRGASKPWKSTPVMSRMEMSPQMTGHPMKMDKASMAKMDKASMSRMTDKKR